MGTHAAATGEKVTVDESEGAPAPTFDDGLPPPTYAQIEYLRRLCGALSQVKSSGMTDDAWPADLAPTKPTLNALVERSIIVRRGRAWHLKRDWYRRICALRQRAVPTAYATLAERPRPDLPSCAEIEGFEQICRWLDAQPKRRARLPFVGLREQLGAESDVPIALLHLMRKFRIARHTSSCEWALSPTWKDRLRDLWDGIDREVREQFPLQPTPSDPYVVAAGIDTWYLNRIDFAGLPSTLRHELDELQAKSAEDEEEVDTRWVYDGVPLRMYQAGVSAKQGGGVSWAYILRNNSLALLVRRAPLGGIVAQARLGSECLWRLTPRRAMDELDVLVRRMWASPIPFPRQSSKGSRADETARWQVSQIHLAVDVANAPRALGEVSASLEAIEMKKTLAGKDFGELVRERRRQFGLPLPIADKVLPIRPSVGKPPRPMETGEVRLSDAWERLVAAEFRGDTRKVLEALEEEFHAAEAAQRAPLVEADDGARTSTSMV